MNTHEKDDKYVGRDTAPLPIEITKSDGAYLYDEKGTKYILNGLCKFLAI